MSILYIITQADGGGAQKYVLQMAKAFKGAIAAGTEASQLFADANKSGIPVFPLKHLRRSIHPLFDLLALFEIRNLIQKIRPDIVHLNSSKAGVLGSIAAWGTGTKVVFTAHGFVFLEPASPAKRNFFLALEKIASDFRDFIITVSDADRKAALEHRLIAPEKIQTIYNGLEPIVFFPKDHARNQLAIPLFSKEETRGSSKIIIGTIANFYPTKGLDIFIKAVSLLPKDIKEKILVVIIGHGPEAGNLKFEINKWGLSEKIYLVENQPSFASFLKAFDIFTLPSRKEGFPFAILEAMQAGLPVVATQTGGVPEAVKDAGLLVPSENPEALSEAITTLVNHPEKREEFSQKSLERSRLFSLEKAIQETKKVYERLLKPRA